MGSECALSIYRKFSSSCSHGLESHCGLAQWFSTQQASASPGGLVRLVGPHSESFPYLRSGVGSVICIFKFPGNAVTPGLGTAF